MPENQPITFQNWASASDIPPTHPQTRWSRIYLKRQSAAYRARVVTKMASLKEICGGLPVDPLPSPRDRDDSVPHAPVRAVNLSDDERRVWNNRNNHIDTIALNFSVAYYFPPWLHKCTVLSLI